MDRNDKILLCMPNVVPCYAKSPNYNFNRSRAKRVKKFPRKIASTGETNSLVIDFAPAHDNNFHFSLFVYACHKNGTKGNSEKG